MVVIIQKHHTALVAVLLLLLCLPGKAWGQGADGSQSNPYEINLANPIHITDVIKMDEVTIASNKYKRITLLKGGTSADARVYYKLSGAANIIDKVILWNYLKDADNTESTATHITLLVDGSDVSLYGMHLGGDVSLEAVNGEGDKLIVSGSSSYSESPYSGGSGYALSFMEGYHFQVGAGLRVEVTSLDSNNNSQAFPDVVSGTFTINGTLMGGINSSSVGSSSTANTKIAIAGTNNAILQIDVPNGVTSSSLILKKKEGDTFTDYLTLPAKIAADNTKSINTYSICVPAGTYQCWDGDAMLEQFNNSKGGSIKTSFETTANAVTLYRCLCLPFDLSTIKEATTFQTWVTNKVVYWGATTNVNGNTRTVFSRLTQSTETVKYPVTFSNTPNNTRYLLCSSNINIEVSGDVPALYFGEDVFVKFIQGNDATKLSETMTMTLANEDNSKCALEINNYSNTSLRGSLIVNGSVNIPYDFNLYGSLEINTPKGTPNITPSDKKIWLKRVTDKERYVKLSDYRDDKGDVISPTVSISPAENISELTFSNIAFEPLYNGVSPTAKVQPGLTLAIKTSSTSYQFMVSKHTSNGYVENSPLIPVDNIYSYKVMEEDKKFEEIVILGTNLRPFEINGPLVPFTLTCDKHGIWTYTTVSSNGTYTDLFNGTLTLNKNIGKDAGDQPIDVIVEGDTEGTLILDAVALQPTSGDYAIKVNKGKLKISPKNSKTSTIIPPVKDGVYQPALLVAKGASCEVTFANSGNIRFYGEAKAEETGIIKGLVQLQWANPIDKEVQITEKGKTELAATFPALPNASPKPSIVAWNPNANSSNWSKEYIVKKDGKQQVGKNLENKEVTSFAYSASTGNLTIFKELCDISASEMVGEANVGVSGTDVTITNKEYLVKTPIGLAWIAAVTNKKLTTGDAATPSENGFAGCTVKIGIGIDGEALDLGKLGFAWVPIGNSAETPFKGTFDGQFHLVKNLPFAPCGLIGVADGATISGVGGELIGSNSEISGSSWGGLVGTAQNGTTIKSCFVKMTDPSATITLAGSTLTTVGGVAGRLDGSGTLITDCFSTLNLSVPDKEVTMGGVAGVLTDGATVSNGYCAGSLSAPKGTVAGIVGAGSATLCLTLSPSITGTVGSTYRVASIASSDNNYASSKTLLNGAAVTFEDATSVHGAVVYTHDYKGKTVDKWTSDIWGVVEDNLCLNGVWGMSWVDSKVPVTDYLGYELVTVDAKVTYDAKLHKGRDLVIKSTGVLDCPNGASVHDVTIERGGQIMGGSTALEPNKLIVPREIKNQWTTFYSSACELKASALSFALYRNTGYTTTADGDQSWTNSDGEADGEITITQSSPYLLSAETPQTVTFTADKPSILLNKAPDADGTAINTGIFLFKGNPRLHNVEMKNIYVLSADGSRFDLQATYTLKPFECYIVANAQTRSLVRSLSLKDMPTGIDQALAATFRLWSSGGQLCLSTEHDAEVTIVNVAGQVVYHQRIPAGEKRITLPSGIYFVRGEGITYKVKL